MEATLWEPDTQDISDLRDLIQEMREEISRLRRELSEMRCEAGYWKSRHADAVKRNQKLQLELDQARAEILQLKADQFGRKSEKQSATDRSNDLGDPEDQGSAKKRKQKRGQQPGRRGPTRRDYSRLPLREEFIDIPADQCTCGRCGKPFVDMGQTEDSEQVWPAAADDRTTWSVRFASCGGNDNCRNATHRAAAGASLQGSA